MADSYVQVAPDSTGKKLQTYQNVVGANTVEAEAVTLVDSAGAEVAPAKEAGGNLATIAGDTTSIDGKITACNTAAVTIGAALPAGLNAIGKLAANSGVDIGDVDVASIAAGNNNIGDVDVASIAAGNNNIGDVDIASITAGANIIGKVGIDQTTPGTTNRVDIGAALPAGTNAIGKLASNDGVDIGNVDVASIAAGNNNIGDVDVATIAAGNNNIGDVDVASIAAGSNNIGDVDVASIVPGVAATNLGKAEDALHASGDTGIMLLGVRNDTPTALSGTDLDYTPIATDSYGRVKIVDREQVKTFESIRIDTNATYTVHAAVAGCAIKVHCWSLTAQGTVTVTFKSGAAGTEISKEYKFQDREGDNSCWNPYGHFQTAANTLLELSFGAAVIVTGTITISHDEAA